MAVKIIFLEKGDVPLYLYYIQFGWWLRGVDCF